MPKNATTPTAAAERRVSRRSEPISPVELVRESADAMYRAAVECCHQHDRVSRIVAKATLDAEVAAAQKLCALCDQSLQALADAYEQNASAIRPQRSEDVWWRAANALWLASREYVRRNSSCDAATKDIKQHGPGRLGELHTEYELEASALLGLRQAADSYHKCRPGAA